MSLRPPKKTDLSKDWMQKRRDNQRLINPEYHLIVTEGTKTEPEYFNAIREIINEKYHERIHLEVKGQGDNTVNLFEKAKACVKGSPNGYKHVWVVYDTDDFPAENIDVVPALCRDESNLGCQYHAIWSNQCIELWFLLHFSFMHSDLHRNEYYPKLSENLNALSKGNYVKNRKDMFSVLQTYMDDAIRNARALDEINKGKNPSCAAPGTKIYELIEKFKPYL